MIKPSKKELELKLIERLDRARQEIAGLQSNNPQTQDMLIQARAREDALSAVLEFMRGNKVFLDIL